MQDDKLYKSKYDELVIRHKQLESARSDYEQLMKYIGSLVNPRRYDIGQHYRKGAPRGYEVYDGSPYAAVSIWVDGIQGHMVSQSNLWFKTKIDNKQIRNNDTIRGFLQDYDEQMYSEFSRSNFYSKLPEFLRDGATLGTGIFYIEEDIEKQRCIFTAVHPGQIYIAENVFGQVDTVHRKFKLTARQAAAKFKSGLSERLLKASKESPETEFEFIHAVYPNTDRIIEKYNSSNKRFLSCYIEVGSPNKAILSEGGYDIMPYVVWRFKKNSDEIYGYSPAAEAIIEIFSLNQIAKTNLKAGQLLTDPPLNVPRELRGKVRWLPQAYNYYESPDRIVMPAVLNTRYEVSIELMDRLEKSIQEKYRVHFFLMLSQLNRDVTATQIMEMQSEKASLMGPQIDTIIDEGLKPICESVAYIAGRAGRLPEPPDELIEFAVDNNLRSIDLGIEFIGPLAQAQSRLFKMRGIQYGLESAMPIFQLRPETIDLLDWDDMAEEIFEANGMPQRLIRKRDEVLNIRNQRAQQQAAQAQAAMAIEMAKASKGLNKAVEPNSPMEAAANIMEAENAVSK